MQLQHMKLTVDLQFTTGFEKALLIKLAHRLITAGAYNAFQLQIVEYYDFKEYWESPIFRCMKKIYDDEEGEKYHLVAIDQAEVFSFFMKLLLLFDLDQNERDFFSTYMKDAKGMGVSSQTSLSPSSIYECIANTLTELWIADIIAPDENSTYAMRRMFEEHTAKDNLAYVSYVLTKTIIEGEIKKQQNIQEQIMLKQKGM